MADKVKPAEQRVHLSVAHTSDPASNSLRLVDFTYLPNRLQSWKEISEEDALSLTEGYLTRTDGIRLFFQKVGTGPDTVIIPNAAYMFDDFNRLADHRTVIFYDLRNRGRSDAITDASKLKGGVHNDVANLEAVRAYFDLDRVSQLAHSYVGFVVALYAMVYPQHVNRVVQIGPSQPLPRKQYPPHLQGADAISAEANAKLMELQKEGPAGDPEGIREKGVGSHEAVIRRQTRGCVQDNLVRRSSSQ
jgi:pimeloyl-ACP methyl ester carboxylesterase